MPEMGVKRNFKGIRKLPNHNALDYFSMTPLPLHVVTTEDQMNMLVHGVQNYHRNFRII